MPSLHSPCKSHVENGRFTTLLHSQMVGGTVATLLDHVRWRCAPPNSHLRAKPQFQRADRSGGPRVRGSAETDQLRSVPPLGTVPRRAGLVDHHRLETSKFRAQDLAVKSEQTCLQAKQSGSPSEQRTLILAGLQWGPLHGADA